MKRSRISIFTILVFLSSLAVFAQDVIVSDIYSTPTTCGDGADGTITISVSGGIGQYSYLMVKGALPVEVAGPLSSNTYTFTGHERYNNYLIIVSDESDATADVNYYIGIDGPDPLAITSAIAADISCNGANDGSITVTAEGEDGNYIFDLSGPVNETNTTGIFTGLPQGNYTVLVSHAICPLTAVSTLLSINNPNTISISVDAFNGVACYDDNTGSISITPSGGTPGGGSGYTYLWTGPNGFTSTSEDISNLEAGDYSVTVYDANMCSANAGPINISEPGELTAILTSSNDVSCYGYNDGNAAMTPGGGTGGYSFSWAGQSTGLIYSVQNPVNLQADTYDFTLSDNSGCSKTFTGFAIINEPEAIEVTVASTTDVTCPVGSDGSANITPTGGSGTYSFAWTGNTSGYVSSEENPTAMPADVYNLVVTDANGCSQVFSSILTINQPELIGLILNSTTPTSCYGGADGGADISVSGGTLPYTLGWTGTGSGHSSSGETPNDLLADTYDVIVTDGNGCPRTFPGYVSITQPDKISVVVDNMVPVSCNGEASGEIEITPLGGTPGYTYSWSGPNGFTANTRNLTNLEAGSYNVSITDVNGCSGDFPGVATVTTNSSITADFIRTNLTCSGISNGAITSSISGGTAPYFYAWTGPDGFTASTKDISGLAEGDYQLTVTDILGCSQPMMVQSLTVPLPITANVTQVNSDCFGTNKGSIDLSSSGGTGLHLYAWTGPNGFSANTQYISSLEPGAYNVIITAANGCIMPFPNIATITEPAGKSL